MNQKDAEERLVKSRELDELINKAAETKFGIRDVLKDVDLDPEAGACGLISCAVSAKRDNEKAGRRPYPAWKTMNLKREDVTEELASLAAELIISYRRKVRALEEQIVRLKQ